MLMAVSDEDEQGGIAGAAMTAISLNQVSQGLEHLLTIILSSTCH